MLNSIYWRLVIICLSLVFCATIKAAPKIISVGADPWCPYNCAPNNEHQGLMVDIAREALAISGYQLKYEIINWARAKKLVRAGKLDGIIGMSRTEKSDQLYHFSNTPLGHSQICLYRNADEEWLYQSTASLKKRTFGWINDYGFSSAPLDKWVKDHKKTNQVVNVAGKDAHHRLFKLMKLKRINTFAEDRNVIAFELKKSGLENTIKIAGCLKSVDKVHLAFTLKSDQKQAWVKALDSGVDQLYKNGQLDKILSFYGLSKETWMSVSTDSATVIKSISK